MLHDSSLRSGSAHSSNTRVFGSLGIVPSGSTPSGSMPSEEERSPSIDEWSPAAHAPDGLHPSTWHGQCFIGNALLLWLRRAFRRHQQLFAPHRSSHQSSSDHHKRRSASTAASLNTSTTSSPSASIPSFTSVISSISSTSSTSTPKPASPLGAAHAHRESVLSSLGKGSASARRVTLACYTFDARRLSDPTPLSEAIADVSSAWRGASNPAKRVAANESFSPQSYTVTQGGGGSGSSGGSGGDRASRLALRHLRRRQKQQPSLTSSDSQGLSLPPSEVLGPDSGERPRLLSRRGFSFTLDFPPSPPPPPTSRTSPHQASSGSPRLAAIRDAKAGLAGWCPDDEVTIDISVSNAQSNTKSNAQSNAKSTSRRGSSSGTAGRSSSRTDSDGGSSSHMDSHSINGHSLASAGSLVNMPLVRPYLALDYLASWRGMGRCTLTCVRGCTCPPSTIDAHAPDERASLRALHYVTLSSPVASLATCVVRIMIEQTTASGEHRFKLMRLAVGAHIALPEGSAEAAGTWGANGDDHTDLTPPPPLPPSPPPPPPPPFCKSSGLRGDTAGPARCESFCSVHNAPRHCLLCKCSNCDFCSGGRPKDQGRHRQKDIATALQAAQAATAVPPPPPPPYPPPPTPGAGRFDASTGLYVCDDSQPLPSAGTVCAAASPNPGECELGLVSRRGVCAWCKLRKQQHQDSAAAQQSL